MPFLPLLDCGFGGEHLLSLVFIFILFYYIKYSALFIAASYKYQLNNVGIHAQKLSHG